MSDGDSSSTIQNQTLKENLRRFRFMKKPLMADTKDPQSPLKGEKSASTSPKEEPVSPGKPLPEPQSNGVTSALSPDGSPVKRAKKKVSRISTDSEDNTPPSKSDGEQAGEISKSEMTEIQVDHENALKFIIEAFPDMDLLVLQDTLLHSDWDVDTAMAKLTSMDSKPKYTNGTSTGRKRSISELNGVSKSAKKKKKMEMDRYEEDRDLDDDDDDGEGYKKAKVYDSDADSDEEISDDLGGDKQKVFDFLSTANVSELQLMQYCSKKKAELVVDLRPFEGWKDMVEKLQSKRGPGAELLNSAQELLHTRAVVAGLIKKCIKLATRMETAIAAGMSKVRTQPSIMSKSLQLSDYQLVGLNWLVIMHSHQVNGILADEMGLGKTVQIISFLAYLKEDKQSIPGKPHLIVVPASTLENWKNEFERWCPSLNVVTYHGNQEDRKYQRINWAKNGFGDTEVVLTTYSLVSSCPEERKMFRIVSLHYAIFDEAHMLKNMGTQRYENLIKINAPHRILVTGTPLQNNLFELMSLLVFVMPKMFYGKEDSLKALFAKGAKHQKIENEDSLPEFERSQISQAKRIMKPFVLRRLKRDVLKGLPKKTDETLYCPMTEDQEAKYKELIAAFTKQAGKVLEEDEKAEPSESGMTMYMKLRRLSNHPLLLRYHYEEKTLQDMAKRLQNDSFYKDTVYEYIFEDLCAMSDFELHQTTLEYKSCYGLRLPSHVFGKSGKLVEMEKMLPKLREEGHRVLLFSQFVIVLDILEEFFKIRGYKFLRLDGTTPVSTRQDLIDEYNEDKSIFIFMLSTRAGGLGINLTSADTVIIHDVDPNPHNDKQAEDRCHRIGQARPVTVIRMVSKNTIEENIFNLAQEKLVLEREVSSNEDNEQSEKKCVARLLKQALGLDKGTGSPSNSKTPIKSN